MMRTTLTTRSERRLLLHLHLLPTSSWDVVVDALVVIVHGHRQHLLGVGLADDILVQVREDLKHKDGNKNYCKTRSRRNLKAK